MQTHEQAILCAADSIEKLRRCDVFRVMDESNCDRPSLAAYICQKRPDLVDEVTAVMLELDY